MQLVSPQDIIKKILLVSLNRQKKLVSSQKQLSCKNLRLQPYAKMASMKKVVKCRWWK